MLSYEEFQEELMKGLDKIYPDAEKTIKEMIRVNEKKDTIIVDGNDGVSALIYPKEWYRLYQVAEDMDTLLELIKLKVEFEKIQEYRELLMHWEDIKPYLRPYVINLEKNQEYLEQNETVFKEKLDLAYGCLVVLPEDMNGGYGQVKVTKNLLECWDVSEDEIFQAAIQNVSYEIKPMRAVTQELLGIKDVDETFRPDDVMLVLTTADGKNGAAGIAHLEAIHEKAEELQTNFYILPCSVHELILIREADAPPIETLHQMVKEVNDTIVAVEDYLSDNVYYYDREKKEIKIVE